MSREAKRIVATDKSGYANERNITGLPFRSYATRRAPNFFRLPNYLHFRVTGNSHRYWSNLHWDGGRSGYDVLHFFNGLSMGRKPWFSTFETYLPRWGSYGGRKIEWGLKMMARPACKGLFALSACTARYQAAFMEDYPAYRQAIMDKVEVMHPAQRPLLGDISEKDADDRFLDLCLVGADFFRKGGLESLRVVDRLLAKGHPLRLHIVSSMQAGDYATHAGPSEIAAAKRIIGKHPEAIQLHASLPNADVLDLFRRCHLGLLPTWADTYGYSVLEAQAAGCPVISSNVRALPEINPSAAGWLLDMPLDERGNARIGTEAERKAFSAALEEQLEAVLEEVLENVGMVREKGKAALERIKREHSPEKRAAELEKRYDECVGN